MKTNPPYRFSIFDFRFSIFSILLALLLTSAAPSRATVVSYAATNFFGGLALTNALTIEPSDDTGVTLFGGGFILGPAISPTLTNSSSTFSVFPGDYRLTWFNLPYSVMVAIPDTNVTLNIANLVNAGAGTYTYTNNANYLVYGSPGDAVPGTITEKISVGGGLTLTTNTVGSSKISVISLPSSNGIFGSFVGNGSNLVYLRATNIQANSGYLDMTIFSPYITTNLFFTQRGISNSFDGHNTSGQLGGTSNILEGGLSTWMIGGKGNLLYGGASDSAFIGGLSNRMDYGYQTVLLGGEANYSIQTYDGAIIGGKTNRLYGSRNIILGGKNNTIGTFGEDNTVLNGNRNVVANGTKVGNVIGGSDAEANYNYGFIWSGYFGGTNFASTADNQFLIRALGGVGINTNNPGTNQLQVNGNIESRSYTIGGTNLLQLLPIVATSNGIIATINTTSNSLLSIINTASNTVAVAALNAQTSANLASNSVVVASNSLVTLYGPRKAFTATIAATFTSQGQSFNTPLMPDGDYSVSLIPQDAATANSQWTNAWYVDTKSSSGFTIRIPVQNSFNLNFDCIVNDNTQ